LEAKYNLEDAAINCYANGLGVKLLEALQPYAQDPEVAANALNSGLNLSLVPIGLTEQIVSTRVSDGCDSLTNLEQASKLSAVDSGNIWSRSTSAESDATSTETRRLRIKPSFCEPERWTFDVEQQSNEKVLDFRKALSRCMKLPLGKLRLAAQSDDDAPTILSDAEPAQCAAQVLVCNVPAALDTVLAAAAVGDRRLPRSQAVAMQLELLEALQVAKEGSRAVSREILKEVQAGILPKYGFTISPSGVAAMLKAFDAYITDAEIAAAGDSINQILGLQPQSYTLELLSTR